MTIDGATLCVGGFELHLLWVIIGVLAVAYYIGILSARKEEKRSREKWQREREQIADKYLLQLKNATEDTRQCAPWMAGQFADFLYMYDAEISQHLSWKKHPALTQGTVPCVTRGHFGLSSLLRKANTVLAY